MFSVVRFHDFRQDNHRPSKLTNNRKVVIAICWADWPDKFQTHSRTIQPAPFSRFWLSLLAGKHIKVYSNESVSHNIKLDRFIFCSDFYFQSWSISFDEHNSATRSRSWSSFRQLWCWIRSGNAVLAKQKKD